MGEWLMKELVEKVKLLEEENKKLKETNFKLLGRVSTYTEKLEQYEKALNECIHQDGLMDFLDFNSWACQEDYFVHIGKKGLYGK